MQRVLILLGALVALAAAGCSPGAKTGTVTGEVTLDGQPLKEGRIQFIPVAGDAGTAGAVITDGKFTAEVPIAKMRVEINANKIIGKRKAYDTPQSPVFDEVAELIPARYNVNSQETLDVKQGSQAVQYQLKSK
jgi:hypothetical protein